ncbi:mip130 [Trypoxylus dichotomus]
MKFDNRRHNSDMFKFENDESAAALLEFKNGRKLISEEINIKEEVMDDDNDSNMDIDEDVPRLGPATFGLQRVGAPTTPKPSPSQPTQVLNARGMPARIRKKNRLFYDDDIVNTPHHRVPSAKKQKPTPTKKQKLSTPTKPLKDNLKSTPKKYIASKDLKTGQSGSPPPAQSPDRKIGQKIELKTRDLTRIEWTKIRRMMGRPRRCSQAFFDQERLDLEKKRNKIRALQQRKATDFANFQDLPSEIPMQLVIGTKVTARLRKPQDGLFTGSIDAVDTSNNTYRITFERQGLGTHSVPDYEVLSNEPPETMTISNFQNKFRPRNGLSPYSVVKSPPYSSKTKKDPLLSVSMIDRPVFMGADLEKLNRDLQSYLDEMQTLCHEIAPEPSVAAMLAPSHLRERCRTEAKDIVQRNNTVIAPDKEPVKSTSVLDLITDLTALMLQVKSLSDSDQNAYELHVLEGTMEQIKRKLNPDNSLKFQSSVEVHMKHIQIGLSQSSSNTSLSPVLGLHKQ